MATAPQAVAGASQGNAPLPPPASAGGGAAQGQILQILKVLQSGSDALQKIFPPSAPMVSAIQDQINQIQAKINETTRPQQPQAPPI